MTGVEIANRANFEAAVKIEEQRLIAQRREELLIRPDSRPTRVLGRHFRFKDQEWLVRFEQVEGTAQHGDLSSLHVAFDDVDRPFLRSQSRGQRDHRHRLLRALPARFSDKCRPLKAQILKNQ